jgi:hypothetical protein
MLMPLSGARAQQCTPTGTNQTCTNSIFLSGGTIGISDLAGQNTLTVTNTTSGTISGSQSGIVANSNANVTNSGTISGVSIGISAFVDAHVTNSGTISAFVIGILANNNATVTNSGTISANGDSGTGIFAINNANVTNSGTISAAGDSGAGFIGLERVGDTNVNTVLLGQNLAFVTPGRSSAVGGLVGGSLDFSMLSHISLFSALEGIWMNDNSTTVTAKGGVRGTF